MPEARTLAENAWRLQDVPIGKDKTVPVTLDPFAIPGYIGTKSIDEVLRRKTELTHISLFTGVGGFDLGFARAGFETRVMVEFAKECCETLRANWHWEELKKRQDYKIVDNKPVFTNYTWKSKEEMKKDIDWYQDREPVILQRDIRTLTTKEILDAGGLAVGETSIISGGPPCQGFSTANTERYIDDPRNFLFLEFVRVVREALPRMLIMENVPGMVSSTKGHVIREVCKEFADCGYSISWNILDAANYGVPQYRQRVILIGKRVDLMYFPEIGNPRLHMGAEPGKIVHSKWYVEKYKLELTEQEDTHDQPKEDARRDWNRREKEKKKNEAH